MGLGVGLTAPQDQEQEEAQGHHHQNDNRKDNPEDFYTLGLKHRLRHRHDKVPIHILHRGEIDQRVAQLRAEGGSKGLVPLHFPLNIRCRKLFADTVIL